MSTKTVTIYATKGQRRATLETSATTWGELREQVAIKGFDLDNLAATESVNRTTLEHAQAALPTGNFTLFLRPTKTKSGTGINVEAMSWGQLRRHIKDTIEQDGDHALEHFNSHPTGKDYTQLGSSQLRTLISSYVPLEDEDEDDFGLEMDDSDAEPENANIVRQVISMLERVAEETENEDVVERLEEVDSILTGIIDDLDGESVSSEDREEIERLEREAREFEEGLL